MKKQERKAHSSRPTSLDSPPHVTFRLDSNVCIAASPRSTRAPTGRRRDRSRRSRAASRRAPRRSRRARTSRSRPPTRRRPSRAPRRRRTRRCSPGGRRQTRDDDGRHTVLVLERLPPVVNTTRPPTGRHVEPNTCHRPGPCPLSPGRHPMGGYVTHKQHVPNAPAPCPLPPGHITRGAGASNKKQQQQQHRAPLAWTHASASAASPRPSMPPAPVASRTRKPSGPSR